ncbi:WecA-like glycosyltransferase [Aquisphaera giovannonii]|uniref:WecA-like glycosyltransferase n=1 Tax=Aquisphaera giovannonii TaxID=406548 RepID=A0A5B9VYU6_9BACT|nr:MraY family glycosyltransferase [Aquisphaera giovannonii]QEH32800.1 WecA-like glycosyltransferase [Aquisphaera giovannonii]
MAHDTAILAAAGLTLAAAAFLLSAIFGLLARRYALRLGFLDRPGGHKGHKAPVPLGGGVAIWLSILLVIGAGGLCAFLARDFLPDALARHASGALGTTGELLRILGLATVIMAMGLIDDRVNLKWQIRLGIQVLCATLLAASGVRVTLFWPFTHPLLGGAVTVLWIVGLTNSFNMLDNMDGLAASVGLIAALLFGGAQAAVGSLFPPAVLLTVVGALAGFLVHNHAPARLYMGDAGSNFLGFLLGAMTVVGTYHVSAVDSPYGVLAPLLVMAVPLYDTTSVILIRLREGRSPFEGDQRHLSHRLVARGLTRPQAVWTIDLITLAGGLGALLLHRLDARGAVVVVAQTVSLLGVVAILELAQGRAEER